MRTGIRWTVVLFAGVVAVAALAVVGWQSYLQSAVSDAAALASQVSLPGQAVDCATGDADGIRCTFVPEGEVRQVADAVQEQLVSSGLESATVSCDEDRACTVYGSRWLNHHVWVVVMPELLSDASGGVAGVNVSIASD